MTMKLAKMPLVNTGDGSLTPALSLIPGCAGTGCYDVTPAPGDLDVGPAIMYAQDDGTATFLDWYGTPSQTIVLKAGQFWPVMVRRITAWTGSLPLKAIHYN